MSSFLWQTEGYGDRLSIFPIQYEDIWNYRKLMEGARWNAQEVDLTRDRTDWESRLVEAERKFITYQLAFFARIDIDVLDNVDSLVLDIDCLESKFVYAAQADQECVHAESYALQIDTVLSGDNKDFILNAAKNIPIIKEMHAWAKKWTPRSLPIEERLVAWAFIEGVMFSASFCSLQWLREKNVLNGITEFNSFIMRDEGIHTMHSCLLYRKYSRRKVDIMRVYNILDELIGILDRFIAEALPVNLIGINKNLVQQYTRHQSNCVLIELGIPKKYNVTNPFKFMEKALLQETVKNNFFERRPTQYQSITRTGAASLSVNSTPAVEYD